MNDIDFQTLTDSINHLAAVFVGLIWLASRRRKAAVVLRALADLIDKKSE